MFGQKKNEMVGGWRKLTFGKLHYSYFLPSEIEMTRSKKGIAWQGMQREWGTEECV
jgi:hypothetical protein